VLLGENQYLQARPDYCQGWGAEDAGDIDQSRLGRRLLHLCGCCLLRSSSDGFRAPLSSRGLALHLRQEFFDSGGWLRIPAASPTVSHSPSSPCSTGSVGGISCKQGNFIVNTCTRDIGTRLHYSRWFTSWDVVSVTFNFMATRLRAALRGLLGGAGRLASRLAA
jgi:hypothetical protein